MAWNISQRIRVKFRAHSGQNLAKLKFEVEHYLDNHVQINQDVSANTNNFWLSIANVAQSKKKKYILQDFASHLSLMLLWFC